MTVRGNDFPEEIRGLREIPEAEARKLTHDVPQGLDHDKQEHPRQLEKERRTPHPAADLDDRDDDED